MSYSKVVNSYCQIRLSLSTYTKRANIENIILLSEFSSFQNTDQNQRQIFIPFIPPEFFFLFIEVFWFKLLTYTFLTLN